MKNTILMKISTPFKHEFKGEVSYIEVPTISGMIGIMPNHMPMISALSEGILKITCADNTVLKFEVKDGFLKFNRNACNIAIKSIAKLEKIA